VGILSPAIIWTVSPSLTSDNSTSFVFPASSQHCRIRQQFSHLFQCFTCIAHCFHFNPVTEQHDQYQRCKLKKEIHRMSIRCPEVVHIECKQTIYISDGYTHRHQRHHTWLTSFHFIGCT